MFFNKLLNRIEKTILNTLKLSFLSWVFVTYAICKGWIKLDSFLNYAIFTAAVIGIKAWQKTKQNMENMQ